jgi:pilus assembly protein CpaB
VARRTLLLIASILTAALGTALIWLYVQGAESRAQQNADLVPILVFTGEAKAGTAAESLPVAPRAVPASVASGGVSSLGDVRGLKLTDRAVPNQLLLRSMLGTAPSSGIAANRGALALSIADPNRVPAQLQVGHRVAVYATGAAKSGGARLVVREIRVLSIGSTVQTPAAGAAAGAASGVPLTIIGFDADPTQAAALVAMLGAGEQPVLYDLGEGTSA